MPTLHTLNRGPSYANCLSDCLSTMADGDTLLLIEDGVYWTLPSHLSALTDISHILALKADVDARGLQQLSGTERVDDDGFVVLCAQHDRVVSWF